MTEPKKFAFVLMPFDQNFNDIYYYGIKETCKDLNVYCERVDEQIFSERILDRIFNQISKADIIVADMTHRNANVFYEVGYAHALGKNVILLTQNSEDIPFDLKHYPHIIYNGDIKFLHEKLKVRIQYFLENEIEKADIDFGLEFFIEGERIENEKAFEFDYQYGVYPQRIKIDILNTSNIIYKNNFKLGLETKKDFYISFETEPIKTNHSTLIAVSNDISGIYPQSYFSTEFSYKSPEVETEKNFLIVELKLKIYTSIELKEIPFTIKMIKPVGGFF